MKRQTTHLWGVFNKDGSCLNVLFSESDAQCYCESFDSNDWHIVKGFFVAASRRDNKKLPYPDWVCHKCGIDGRIYTIGQHKKLGEGTLCSTFHTDKCGVCGITTTVTEPRDYGYPHWPGFKTP